MNDFEGEIRAVETIEASGSHCGKDVKTFIDVDRWWEGKSLLDIYLWRLTLHKNFERGWVAQQLREPLVYRCSLALFYLAHRTYLGSLHWLVLY